MYVSFYLFFAITQKDHLRSELVMREIEAMRDHLRRSPLGMRLLMPVTLRHATSALRLSSSCNQSPGICPLLLETVQAQLSVGHL